ncbi:helix-turn-helix domain-containing protein [Spirosoma foliorum]|uniref:AraC family transcriptional regulator n=1 Tax=Spirosoma foliorum TaxID=2710596 RepID=A0A7G5GVA9_9BACT|nr:helix-turn-helix domain-containing protein [Spirosoma foliorum]QMW02801.1 AraC family transcriptional regulator [Spirosoma foliorum]
MERTIIDIRSINELHQFYGYEKPKHPLVSIIDLSKTKKQVASGASLYRLHFYCVYFKTLKGALPYGRSYYDFDEATLLFTAPYQVVAPSADPTPEKGWGLFFHPDVLARTGLGKKINEYSFFNYASTEALHLSDAEKEVLEACLRHIELEYTRPIDKHTQTLIVTNIELLLNYCDRFYDRQFLTRANVNQDIIQQFEDLLNNYFTHESLTEIGLPDVTYFSAHLNLSPYYLSDVLNKYTGKTTQEHIHLKLVERAKLLLWSTDKSISSIAYDLGFNYPSHFTKLFKSKTGKSPKDFRNLN